MKKTGHIGLDEPFAGLFTQGMVVHETYKAPDGEWVEPAQVTIESEGDARRGEDHRDRRAGRDRRRSRRCRSRRRTSSTPTTSWAATAPTWRAGSCCRIRRPSATSNGPSAACRAPGDSRSGSGGSSARRPRWRRRRRRTRPATVRGGRAGAAQGRARGAVEGVGRDRERCTSTSRSRTSTSSPTRSASSIGAQESAPTPDYALGGARGGRDPGEAVPADDAAPRRGMLGGARAQDAAGDASRGRRWKPELLVENTITLPVQVNGKKRADVTVPRDATNAGGREGGAGARSGAARARGQAAEEGDRGARAGSSTWWCSALARRDISRRASEVPAKRASRRTRRPRSFATLGARRPQARAAPRTARGS